VIEGFELDGADRAIMETVWPEGENVAAQVRRPPYSSSCLILKNAQS